MSDTERTTETIVDGILAAMKSDPYEMGQFIRGILTESLPLVITEEWDSDLGPDFAVEVIDRVKGWYEPDEDDAELIAEEHEIEYEYIDDQYKLAENEPLDVWLRFADESDETPEYEANTFRRYDGDYVIEWYHTDVGEVTAETFGTYEEAESWYEENGYRAF